MNNSINSIHREVSLKRKKKEHISPEGGHGNWPLNQAIPALLSPKALENQGLAPAKKDDKKRSLAGKCLPITCQCEVFDMLASTCIVAVSRNKINIIFGEHSSCKVYNEEQTRMIIAIRTFLLLSTESSLLNNVFRFISFLRTCFVIL